MNTGFKLGSGLALIVLASGFFFGGSIRESQLYGCWEGEFGGDSGYRWHEQFRRDGSVEVEFTHLNEGRIEGRYSQRGSMTVQGRVMIVRLDLLENEDGAQPLNLIERYRVESIDSDRVVYRHLSSGRLFTKYRVSCD